MDRELFRYNTGLLRERAHDAEMAMQTAESVCIMIVCMFFLRYFKSNYTLSGSMQELTLVTHSWMYCFSTFCSKCNRGEDATYKKRNFLPPKIPPTDSLAQKEFYIDLAHAWLYSSAAEVLEWRLSEKLDIDNGLGLLFILFHLILRKLHKIQATIAYNYVHSVFLQKYGYIHIHTTALERQLDRMYNNGETYITTDLNRWFEFHIAPSGIPENQQQIVDTYEAKGRVSHWNLHSVLQEYERYHKDRFLHSATLTFLIFSASLVCGNMVNETETVHAFVWFLCVERVGLTGLRAIQRSELSKNYVTLIQDITEVFVRLASIFIIMLLRKDSVSVEFYAALGAILTSLVMSNISLFMSEFDYKLEYINKEMEKEYGVDLEGLRLAIQQVVRDMNDFERASHFIPSAVLEYWIMKIQWIRLRKQRRCKELEYLDQEMCNGLFKKIFGRYL